MSKKKVEIIEPITGSLMLTILSAIAQMEVENTSSHVKWTLQKKMENGDFVGQAAPLGYDAVDNQLFTSSIVRM